MTSNQTQVQLQQLQKLEQAGRFDEAGNAYQQLLIQNPGHPALLWGLGRCMMHFGRRNSAARLLQQAIAAYPTHPVMTEDIIKRLMLVGHPEAALRLCEEAEARFPGLASIGLQRADALRLLNRQEEAIPLLQEILDSPAPPPGAALSMVTCLRQTGEAEKALQLATRILPDYAGSSLEQAGILNEIAHAQESLGEYQPAFDSLRQSGEIAMQSEQAQAVDATIYPRLLNSQLDWLQAGGLPTPPDYPKREHPRLVFQVGFPRSGTTLVESVLAAHPQVHSSDEAPLFNTALGTLLAAGLEMDTLLEEIPRQSIALLEQAREAYWGKVQAEFGGEFELFVDKQPMNIIYLAHIRLLFPEATIIFCERDPRDVCLSCFFQWFEINSSNKHFLDWQDTATFYRQVMDYWLALRPLLADAAYTLRYEELIADFEGETRKLLDFLRLNWDEEIVAFQEKNRERYFHTPSNQAVRAPVAARAAPRWHHYHDAIEAVHPLLEPIIRALGYPQV